MRNTSLLRSGFLSLSLLAAASAPALALDASKLDAVLDKKGDHVLDKRGNCVRTKWEHNGEDPCGKAPEKLAAPAAPDALHSEELVVYFPFDSATLTAESTRKLDEVATILKGSKGLVNAKIVGYADRMGDETYNQRLSQRRADAVTAYLASKGYVAREKAQLSALGETSAKERCLDVKGRTQLIQCLWKERKVEVKLDFNK